MINASSLTDEVKNLIIKVARITEIAKTNPVDSPAWLAACDAVSPLYKKLASLNAPHPDHIDWAA